MAASVVRLSVHVRPGSSAPGVGGTFNDALVVRVRATAHDGRATREALALLAGALGLPVRAVRLERGATTRHKLVAIDDPTPELAAAIERLRAVTPPYFR
ncbi:MAG: DUF167 domain-containing protein [Acidimicrobiales bacterium]